MPVSFTFLFLPSSISVTSPLFTSDARSLSALLSQGKGRTAIPIFLLHLKTWDWMSERWGHLRGPRAADFYSQGLSHSGSEAYVSYDYVLVTPARFFSAAQIFPPLLALSKKNTPDEFHAEEWQLFHFTLRLLEEGKTHTWKIKITLIFTLLT